MADNNDENGNDSDNSSSLGDDEYESPPGSDFESGDEDIGKSIARKRQKYGNDSFTYEPQKFRKQDESKSSSPLRKRSSTKKSNDIENRLLLLDRKKQARLAQNVKRDSLLDDSDDDSVLGPIGDDGGKNDSNEKEEIKIVPKISILDNSIAGYHAVGNSDLLSKKPPAFVTKPESIELLSSDDSCQDSTPFASNAKELSVIGTSTRQPLQSSTIISKRSTRSSTRNVAATNESGQAGTISCLDSDDDDDVAIVAPPETRAVNLPSSVAASLQHARQARERLKQSQKYSADDVHVAVRETEFIPPTPDKATAGARRAVGPLELSSNSRMNLGTALQFTCHCGHIVTNGQKESTAKDKQSIKLSVREKEPLSALVKKFCSAHSLPQGRSEIVMTFDGCRLDVSKTPAFYEMEDQDQIDVSAKVSHRSTASGGSSLQLTCRIQIKIAAKKKTRGRSKKAKNSPTSKPEMTTKAVSLRETERLEVLVKRLLAILELPPATTTVVIRFDGEVLDMDKSPKSYEMEDQDMIEVSIEKQAV